MKMLQRGFTHLFLVILITLGIGVLGYYSVKNGQIKITKDTGFTKLATDTPLNKTDDSKTYKYRNLEFKYPSDWITDESERNIYPPNNIGITLWVNGENNNPVFGKCFKETEVIDKERYTITKYEQIVPESVNDVCWGAGMETGRSIRVANKSDEKSYPIINYQYSSDNAAEAEKILDSILATLRFDNSPQPIIQGNKLTTPLIKR